jgi:hypothetical protein
MRSFVLACAVVALVGCGSESPSADELAQPDSGAAGESAGAGGNAARTDAGKGGTSASGGSTMTGGQAGTGGAVATGGNVGTGGGSVGTGGSTGTGGFVPAVCADAGSTVLPGGAPTLTAGTWKDISPTGGGLSFTGGANLTQGMAMDPCNPATLYVCICASGGSAAYPKGVYRTTDAGSSWTRLHAFDSCVHVRVDPKDPQHLYVGDGVAGGTHGFWVSKDGGSTWAQPKGFTDLCNAMGIPSSCGMGDIYDVAVDPTDFNHVLLSFHSPWTWGDSSKGAGVVESMDGGNTWVAHNWPNQWGYGHSIHFLYYPALGIGNSSTWLLGIQNGGGRWRTTDAGKTWTKVSDVSIVHGGGTIYYNKSRILYASGDPQVIRSSDNGVTWTGIGKSFGGASVIGDGKLLYTGPLFGPTPFITAPETDDKTWSDYNAQTFSQGPFEMAFDAANGILYSATQSAGVWALKVK